MQHFADRIFAERGVRYGRVAMIPTSAKTKRRPKAYLTIETPVVVCPFRDQTLRDLPVLCPSVLDESAETQRCYRLGDLDRIFLVGISAPAGMTDRNMLDVMPRAFTCSNIPQSDHFPTLKLKASYLIERASDDAL
jgi:hypothetical protein